MSPSYEHGELVPVVRNVRAEELKPNDVLLRDHGFKFEGGKVVRLTTLGSIASVRFPATGGVRVELYEAPTIPITAP